MAKADKRSYKTRVCVPAPIPVACPGCGGHDTIADDGVHFIFATGKRVERRTCRTCRRKFVAMRDMTDEERARRPSGD